MERQSVACGRLEAANRPACFFTADDAEEIRILPLSSAACGFHCSQPWYRRYACRPTQRKIPVDRSMSLSQRLLLSPSASCEESTGRSSGLVMRMCLKRCSSPRVRTRRTKWLQRLDPRRSGPTGNGKKSSSSVTPRAPGPQSSPSQSRKTISREFHT
jgi:hypothetical protein